MARFAVSHYRTFDNDPLASPFRNVGQLPAGNWLRYKDGDLKIGTYWELSELPDLKGEVEDLAAQYRELMFDAAAKRLARADNPVFTLSGGMDSSSVLASSVAVTGSKKPAISTVYEDKTYDESEDIQSMLEANASAWHRVNVDRPDVFGLVEKMIRAHDEPVATATWLSHFILCEQARELGYGAVFGGLGGDELNAGEYEYFFFHFADLKARGDQDTLDREIALWARYHDHPIWKKDRAVAESAMARLTDPSRPGTCLPDRARCLRYLDVLNRDFYDLEGFEPVMDHPFGSCLKNRTCQDIFRETAPCCLRAEDRQTVHHELDNFLPFFDHRMVEFMFRIPGGLKIKEGVTKYLLREAMKGVLPEETRTRIKKTGWNAPAHLWFSGCGGEKLGEIIHSREFGQRGIYNVAKLEKLLEEHRQIVARGLPEENHMMLFWQVLNLELWLRHVDGLEL